jgi:hypothetical protein
VPSEARPKTLSPEGEGGAKRRVRAHARHEPHASEPPQPSVTSPHHQIVAPRSRRDERLHHGERSEASLPVRPAVGHVRPRTRARRQQHRYRHLRTRSPRFRRAALRGPTSGSGSRISEARPRHDHQALPNSCARRHVSPTWRSSLKRKKSQ